MTGETSEPVVPDAADAPPEPQPGEAVDAAPRPRLRLITNHEEAAPSNELEAKLETDSATEIAELPAHGRHRAPDAGLPMLPIVPRLPEVAGRLPRGLGAAAFHDAINAARTSAARAAAAETASKPSSQPLTRREPKHAARTRRFKRD